MEKKVYLTILLVNMLLLVFVVYFYRNASQPKEAPCSFPLDYNSYSPVRSYCLEDLLNATLTDYYHHGAFNNENKKTIASYIGLLENDRLKIASHDLVIKDNTGILDGTLSLEKFFLSMKININKQFRYGEFGVDSVLFNGKEKKLDVYFNLRPRYK